MRAQGRAEAQAAGVAGDSGRAGGERPDGDSPEPSPKPFQVIHGGPSRKKGQTGNYVCTWCGARFEREWRLKEHWRQNPRCRVNKSVSNPTASKYEEPTE